MKRRHTNPTRQRGRTSRAHRRKGFTLVEMMVAVALLGIGIAACVSCIGTTTRASALAEQYTAVQLLAREKLSEIELQGAPEGEDQGDFGAERPGFAWRTVAEPAGVTGLRRVHLFLLWGNEEHPRVAEFTTYVRGASQPSSAAALLRQMAARRICAGCHGGVTAKERSFELAAPAKAGCLRDDASS